MTGVMAATSRSAHVSVVSVVVGNRQSWSRDRPEFLGLGVGRREGGVPGDTLQVLGRKEGIHVFLACEEGGSARAQLELAGVPAPSQVVSATGQLKPPGSCVTRCCPPSPSHPVPPSSRRLLERSLLSVPAQSAPSGWKALLSSQLSLHTECSSWPPGSA